MVPFSDLRPIFERHRDELVAATTETLASGWYILGPRVERFEAELAAFLGRRHAVAVANGTDAIELALRAHGIGLGDEVVTVSHTAVATVAAVEATGATPVLVDVDSATGTMDPAAASAAITPRTAALLPVHLYGHPAAMAELQAVARRSGLLVVEDCAQALGARQAGRRAGALGDIAAISFYPTKTLGAFGDAGAVVTDDAAVAERLRRLRTYGQSDRYHHVERGINSRMDEIQAANLTVLLAHLDAHTAERREHAAAYPAGLTGLRLPVELDGSEHAYHLFVVRSGSRDELQAHLGQAGVQTLIHYPLPVHLQPAYADLGIPPGSLPVTEQLAGEILSLPLYVGLTAEQRDQVIAAVQSFAAVEARP